MYIVYHKAQPSRTINEDTKKKSASLYARLLQPCASPTGLMCPVRFNPKSSRQVHGKGVKALAFSKVIDQHLEEDAKCLQFIRLRIWGLYQNKL